MSRVVMGFPADFKIAIISSKDSSSVSLCSLKSARHQRSFEHSSPISFSKDVISVEKVLREL